MRARLHGALLGLLLAAAGCASLPPLEGRVESRVLPDTSDTALGRATQALAAQHPGLTGIHGLPVATDAFAARMLLALAAERSIDAQYYILRGDTTGLMLLHALREAARRGVRVRLLVDDAGTGGLDDMFAALAREPRFEIRLYNPFARRSGKALGYLADFSRLNRRMHNKSFTVDNHASIVGGRNVGNEYFGAEAEVPFRDLDVVAIGAAVPAISTEFDLYWNSASAYPAQDLLPPATDADRAAVDARFQGVREDPAAEVYIRAVKETPLVQALLDRRLALEWAPARVVRDDPAKTLEEKPKPEHLALADMMELAGPPQREFDLISPYFVPAEQGTARLAALAKRGVTVRILTNSLSSTDVSVVHSGYAKRRCELARAGVKLYELKPTAMEVPNAKREGVGSSGSGGSSLHAKTFAVDGVRAFVGSFNFDPRSAMLNTEMGLLVDSPVLAGRLAAVFGDFVRDNAYEVRAIDGSACIEWVEHTAAGDTVHTSEPGVSALRRFWLGILMAMPLDWML